MKPNGWDMKSGNTFLSIFVMALYLFFPGNGLVFANHHFHDRGLPEIDCPCCGETAQHAGHPGDGGVDDGCVHASDCACSSHIPLSRTPLEYDRIAVRVPFREPLFSITEVYYPIFVPPRTPAA